MNVHSVINNPYAASQRDFKYLDKLKRFVSPIRNNVVSFIHEKPLIAGSALLAVAAFFTSFFSRATTSLLPILGIPAVTLFGYEIFSNMKDSVKK